MKPTKIEALTFLRFIAAAFVVIFHYGRDTNVGKASLAHLYIYGPAMVTFFFVLSGFVLTLAYYEKTNVSLKSYYVARIARIVPVYLITLGLVCFFVYGQENNTSKALLLNIAFLQSWFPPYPLSLNTPAWSLSVEAFFYLTFPIILFLVRSAKLRPQKALLVSLLIWLFTQAILSNLINSKYYVGGIPFPSPPFDIIYYFPLSHYCSFLLGVAGGYLFLQTQSFHKNNGKTLFLILLLAIAVNYLMLQYPDIYEKWLGFQLPTQSSFYGPVFLFLILCVSYSKNIITNLLSLRIFVLLGEASYSLYIWQYPVHITYSKYFSTHLGLNKNNDFLCFFVILVGISIISFYIIEKPESIIILKTASWLSSERT